MTRVVINRAKWGKGQLYTKKTGAMCVLGFCAKAAGVKPENMGNYAFPSELMEWYKVAEKFPMLFGEYEYKVTRYANETASKLILANDTGKHTPAKEQEIKSLGKEADIQFVFTGDYA